MTEHDVLARATKALRDAHDGESARAPFTRARVMRSLHEEKKKRLSRTLLVGPLAAIWIGGTAWAAATGQLPELLERAERWIVNAQAPTLPATAIPELEAKRATRARASTEPVPTPLVEEVPELAETIDPVEPEAVPEPPKPVARQRRAAPPEVKEAPSEAPALEPPPETPRDPELAAFRRAHDLDFRAGQPSAANAAYREYLEQYPSGRFVPEARYNTALNLLELGQRDRARTLLVPFAEGRYGAYRKSEAQGLIDALDGKGGASGRDP